MLIDSRLVIILIWCVSTTTSFAQVTLSISDYIQNRVEQLDPTSSNKFVSIISKKSEFEK